ncbi:60S ribosomal protein L28-like [Choloepus didactylus]|uniref:60S ribosomal protein L28-like n=1 Tax=Choloepus didactylus TaxID=27675 RepID=UPI00189DDF3A|nr:60S ribosomal protein L28-like [Choloepus didactylus]
MAPHLQWMVLRNCSSFLIKRNKQKYSTEPSNLKACSSFSYSVLIHCKTGGVELVANGKGVMVELKQRFVTLLCILGCLSVCASQSGGTLEH